MKNLFLLSLVFCSFTLPSYCQSTLGYGGHYTGNDATNPCIGADEYKEIRRICLDNIKALPKNALMQKKAARTHFYWPLKPVSGLKDSSYYFISAYVDHNTADTSIKDYNCGRNTYDTHRGTDIGIWPFPFYKMDNNQVQVVAAAPGFIINKVDGQFDKNCAGNNLTANYIVIIHPDSSLSLYLHMKKNSLTSKKVGDAVSTGDFLGIVGSSGSSSGPHLHFEVWENINKSSLQDPFAGTCNKFNDSTWWVNQKPYREPAIIAADVDTAEPIMPGCPSTETPNEDSCFTSGFKAVVAVYYRDETVGMTTTVSILNPDGSTNQTWTRKSNKSYNASYWVWHKTLPLASGKYTLEASYNGITIDKKFTVDCGAVSGINLTNNSSQIQLSPNPASGILNISGEGLSNGNYSLSLTNILGEVIMRDHSIVENNTLQKSISVSAIPNGIYFMTIENGNEKIVKKFVKQE